MAAHYGSLSRSLTTIARVSRASPPPLPRLRPSPSTASLLHRRRPFLLPPRIMGELGCTQSFLPFNGVPQLTSHLSLQSRACSELFYGMNGKDG